MEYIVTLHSINCFFLVILQSVLLLPYAMREDMVLWDMTRHRYVDTHQYIASIRHV